MSIHQKISDQIYMEEDLEDEIQEELKVEAEECEFNKDPQDDMYDDYVFIRKKLRFSVAACETVLNQAFRDLVQNPAPRVVEGCSAIIKTITDCTNQLLTVHEKIKKINPIKEDNDDQDKNVKSKKLSASVHEIIDALEERDEDEIDQESD